MPFMWYRYLFLCMIVSAFFDAKAQNTNTSPPYGYNQFRNKLPFTVKDSVVSFFLRGYVSAHTVLLVGSFTGWHKKPLSMTRVNGGWLVNIKLSPGKYTYQFLIDNSWKLDPDNLQTEIENGKLSSLYYVPNIVFSFPAHNTAKKIFLVGSFNHWKPGELQLLKRGDQWQLPLYLADSTYTYRYSVDGKEMVDPANNNRFFDHNAVQTSYLVIGKAREHYEAHRSNERSLIVTKDQQVDTSMVAILISKGDSCLQKQQYEAALHHFNKALQLYHPDKGGMAPGKLLIKVSLAYRGLKDVPQELTYTQKAIQVYERIADTLGLASAYRKLGYYYLNFGGKFNYDSTTHNLDKAIVNFQKSNSLFLKLGVDYDAGTTFGNLAHAYSVIGDSEKSIEFTKKSLELNQKVGNLSGVGRNLQLLSVYNFRVQKNFPKAFEYLRMSTMLFEQVQNDVSKQDLAENYLWYALYYMEAPDDAISYLGIKANERMKKAIELRRNAYVILKEIGTTFRYLTSLVLLSDAFANAGIHDSAYYYYKQYIKVRDEVVNTDKQKEMARIESRYEFERREDSLKLVNEMAAQDLQHRMQLNRQKQWIYSIGGFVLLGLGSLFFIHRIRLQSVRLETQLVKEKAEQEQKESEFQRKVADISLSALRSQMNPHFIFNCLNSIKLYTIENDTAAASEYLTKFSRLIRRVLDNSRNERITLSSELKALELYIEMEAMRFKEKLKYSISVPDDLETEYIEIPPLLLQPYVENAIWHGLMYKEEGGHIDITASMSEDNSVLEITITDDGVGRAKAMEIKSKSTTNHRSYGMKATSDRIAFINQTYKTGATVNIQDLVDVDGKPAGTQVIIQIPV